MEPYLFLPNLISGKNILIGVTGSISIYKILDLISMFKKSNAKVKVVMSESAKKFISPLTFETISENIVLEDRNQSWPNNHNHISFAKWADIFLIAPATTNTINKLASGICDNVLLDIAMASNAKILIAPSANTQMIENKITKINLKKLEDLDYKIIPPQIKRLACGDIGNGGLAKIFDIFLYCTQELVKSNFWKNKNVVITGGGTIEKIDNIRYISNFSSGKMANSLSLALFLKGANVTLISTKDSLDIPIKYILVESSQDMLEEIKKINLDFLFMASAVSDFLPFEKFTTKIKKDKLEDIFEIKFKKNLDILNCLKDEKYKKIGFKLEDSFEVGINSARDMLNKKSLDLVCLNSMEQNPLGSEKNSFLLISKDRELKINEDTKLNLSFQILDFLEGQL